MKGKSHIFVCLLLIFRLGGYDAMAQARYPVIRLAEAVSRPEKIHLSEIANSVTFIPLEKVSKSYFPSHTKENQEPATVFLSKDKIISACEKVILFDRRNGKFLYSFSSNISPFCTSAFNEITNGITTYGKQSFTEYATDGRKIRQIPYVHQGLHLPEYIGHIAPGVIASIDLKRGINRPHKIYISDTSGVIATVPQQHPYNWEKLTGGFFGNSYYYKNKLFLYEESNDTIFLIDKSGEHPYVIAEKGKFRLTAEKRRDITLQSIDDRISHALWKKIIGQHFSNFNFCENDRMILFNFLYEGTSRVGYFDKRTQSCHIAQANKNGESEFINDLNEFLPIPAFHWIINEQNVLTGIIPAGKAKDWFKYNQEKIIRLTPEQRAIGNIKKIRQPGRFHYHSKIRHGSYHRQIDSVPIIPIPERITRQKQQYNERPRTILQGNTAIRT